MTHTDMRKKWIEDHIDDIDACNWEKFYMELDQLEEGTEYGDLYYQVGLITDILMEAGINPLDTTTIIYPNMFCMSDITELNSSHITMLGRSAFYSSRLKHFVIPEGVKDIPMECFEECNYLEDLVIPRSVVRISNDAIMLNSTTLKVYKHSYAEKWAKEHDADWEYIE